MSRSGLRNLLVLTALFLLPSAVLAQEGDPDANLSATRVLMNHDNTVSPTPVGPTPRTADGHPDLSGVWNGSGESLEGVANQMYNAGIEVRKEGTTRDVHSGAQIATWLLPKRGAETNEQAERAATLLRRVGSNKPLYKPQYWQTVKDFDANANDDDPSNQCMPAGVPRVGIPSYVGQTPTYLLLIYPGQGGLIATQTSYRMIPLDGRKHTNIEELDGTWNGEGIGHWEGDTMVIDTIGFNSSSWFDQLGGYFHSENMHVVERLHRDGNTLTWTATVDDPDVLLKPWTSTPRTVILNPNPGALLGESLPCSERDLAHAATKEHH
jgi:hypothetical protein